MGPITEYDDLIFGIKENTVRPYEYFDDVHIAIAYEFDLNLYRIDREAYNLLDWLGDLGGLKEAGVIILGFICGIFNYHTFEDYLVSQLYRSETAKDRFSKSKYGNEEDLYLKKQEGRKLELDKVNCLT